MTFDTIKNNVYHGLQRAAAITTQTANEIKSAVPSIMHGALHTTAHLTDELSKAVLLLGLPAAGLLLADSYFLICDVSCGKGPTSLFGCWNFDAKALNIPPLPCTDPRVAESAGLVKAGLEKVSIYTTYEMYTALALLVAAPIASLAFRKISQLATRAYKPSCEKIHPDPEPEVFIGQPVFIGDVRVPHVLIRQAKNMNYFGI